ncbi:protein FAR1-RELATED SEQUENCE 5-like [Tasmannia lanceolata]|uniref:protein FAR1-RELATED SEQUENCE 5-like n=1 Tax=Tasmannia lanceolata TaxID=3420 RepID=UPI0040634BAA
MELDVDGNLRSMFWADSRAREAYLKFCNVIVFDVTYKTNRYRMPFAPFTGVNHHRQSTLFGCALLADEKDETFTWLFKQWLDCMFGKAPGCIITDMDVAMRNAITTVFPNTWHRFCSWHINKHLIEHVPAMRDSTNEFFKEYNHWFYRRQIEDCLTEWEKLVHKHHVDGKSWLGKMWELRRHWVPAYFRDTFTAGMTLSSRSESMNAFFDGFVNQNTTLQEFVEQYDNSLTDRRDKESEVDFKSKTSSAVLKTRSTLESQASKVYTSTIFNIFQAQFKDSTDCWDEELGKNDTVSEYLVRLSDENRWKWCKVVYEESESEGVKATFRARHHLGGGVATGQGGDDDDEGSPLQRWYRVAKFHRVLDKLQKKKSLSKKVDESLDLWCAEGEEGEEDERENPIVLPNTSSQVQSNFVRESSAISIRDPMVVRTKGRPKTATRFKSGVEKSKEMPRQRTCGDGVKAEVVQSVQLSGIIRCYSCCAIMVLLRFYEMGFL